MSYKIVKVFSGGGQVFVNDSEGIAMEWDNPFDALEVAKKFQESSKHNSRYYVIDHHQKQFEVGEELLGI
jgi:hypothetical protein